MHTDVTGVRHAQYKQVLFKEIVSIEVYCGGFALIHHYYLMREIYESKASPKKLTSLHFKLNPNLLYYLVDEKIFNFPVLNQEERELSPLQFFLSLNSRNQKK